MYEVNQMKGVRGRFQGDNNLEEVNEAIDDNKIIKDTFKVLFDTYTLAQGYKHTCEMMHMVWCNAEM
jgi:hypothetical protein